MTKENIKDCIVLYNPVSTHFKEESIDDISKVLKEHGIKHDFAKSKEEGHLIKLVQNSDEENRLIITLGGDGTVGEAYMAFNRFGQKGIYAHVPTGTANDMAKNYDVKETDHALIVNDILNGEIKMIDTYSINGKPSAYVSAFGYLTHIPYVTPPFLKNYFKYFGYIMEAAIDPITHPSNLMNLIFPPKYNISYETDNLCTTDNFILGAVANSKGFAGINVFDNAKLDDGKIELLLVKDLPISVIMSIAKDFFGKKSVDLKKYKDHIVLDHSSTIKLTFNEKFPKYPVDVDGENSRIGPTYKDRDLIFKVEEPVRVMKRKD